MTLHAPFEELEALVNRETVAQLSNAVATLAGREVQGIFDAGHELGQVGLTGAASARVTLTLPTASVPTEIMDWLAFFSAPDLPVDLACIVRGVRYQITAHEPDGTGMSVLVLSKEAA